MLRYPRAKHIWETLNRSLHTIPIDEVEVAAANNTFVMKEGTSNPRPLEVIYGLGRRSRNTPLPDLETDVVERKSTRDEPTCRN